MICATRTLRRGLVASVHANVFVQVLGVPKGRASTGSDDVEGPSRSVPERGCRTQNVQGDMQSTARCLHDQRKGMRVARVQVSMGRDRGETDKTHPICEAEFESLGSLRHHLYCVILSCRGSLFPTFRQIPTSLAHRIDVVQRSPGFSRVRQRISERQSVQVGITRHKRHPGVQ